MSQRVIRHVHSAVRDDIADLVTRRALPTSSISLVDPFLFLNHHGPQVYPAPNRGLPFGPHPHRGFETVTFILEGDLAHEDSGGHSSVIGPGGVQWMTAGRGLVHSEISSPEFLKNGGALEILQLWVNLPSRLKMTDPKYVGLQGPHIPSVTRGVCRAHVVSGEIDGVTGPFSPLYDIQIARIEWTDRGTWTHEVPAERNIFFYVVRGRVTVNGTDVEKFHLVDFENEGNKLEIAADPDTQILLGHAVPFNEPVVSYGPFVMNTQEQIREAIRDYQNGKFE